MAQASPTPSRPSELSQLPGSEGAVGRAVLKAARDEQPTSNERERILAGVLAALQQLTSANE